MKFIERVSIHRFRSIGDAEFEADSINIFSGTNNSGKSNVLRALNLFFNGETAFHSAFGFENDYNKAYTGWYGGKREIQITLHFAPQGNAALSKPFRIIRTFGIESVDKPSYEFESDDPDVQAKIDKKDGNIWRQFNTFLGRIEYLYIPAVRDKSFVSDLLLRFEQLLNADPDNNFEEQLDKLSNTLADQSAGISQDFEKFIHLQTEAALSTNITDILGAVQVMVESGIEITKRVKGQGVKSKVKVDLFSTGDGILMSYLAYFLAHITKKLGNKRFIWGFEEPENSLEYTKTQRLASDFASNFTKGAQIFMTTHSPAFIKLREQPNVKFYRVFIGDDDPKRITQIADLNQLKAQQQALFDAANFTGQYKQLSNEIGLVEQAAEIEGLVGSIVQQQKELREAQQTYEQANASLISQQPAKIFICEDGSTQIKNLWKHLLSLKGMADVEVWPSDGSTTDAAEVGIKEVQKRNPQYKPVVVRQIDRDGLSVDRLQAITNRYDEKYKRSFPYKLMPLPVNEVENFAVLADATFDDSVWLQHQEDLRDAFERTAASMFDRFSKVFRGTGDSSLFPDGPTRTLAIQEMRKEAQVDWRRFMPGKEMVRARQNYNFARELQSASYYQLPLDLRRYLSAVEAFYKAP